MNQTELEAMRVDAIAKGLPMGIMDHDKTAITFDGWWEANEMPDSPEPWEHFTLKVHGEEAGDSRNATPFDMERAGYVPIEERDNAVTLAETALRKAADIAQERDRLREVLVALITHPRVVETLAPLGSLGSLLDAADAALAATPEPETSEGHPVPGIR